MLVKCNKMQKKHKGLCAGRLSLYHETSDAAPKS